MGWSCLRLAILHEFHYKQVLRSVKFECSCSHSLAVSHHWVVIDVPCVMVDNPMGMSEAIQACLEGTARHGAYFSGASFGVEFAPPKPKEIASKD